MRLTVVGRTFGINRAQIEKVAKAAFSYLNLQDKEGDVELKFVSERVMQELNLRYRDLDKPTDVLSFCLSEKPELVGQIFICYTYTLREANKNSRNIEDEIALLIVHGILHLVGYEHETMRSEQKMQEIERAILSKEGFTR